MLEGGHPRLLGRGERWTDKENNLLQDMVKQGITTQQIYESGTFPSRTFRAIENQVKRLDVLTTQKKKSLSGQISEAEILGLESVIRRFVDAFNKICDLTMCSKEDLERFRIIFSAARAYFDLYFRLEEFGEVKNRVERLEALVAQLASEKKAKDAT